MLPLLLSRRGSRNREAVFRYFLKLSIVYVIVFFGVVVVCLIYTIGNYNNPMFPLGNHFLTTQFRECGYRFVQLRCETSKMFERECFALGMCVVQPLYLLKAHTFLSELVRILWVCRRQYMGTVSLWILSETFHRYRRVVGYQGRMENEALEESFRPLPFWQLPVNFGLTERIRNFLNGFDDWYRHWFLAHVI
ncbi:hypothetical protein LZ554_007820 [Drepanopeziza brunnea f. sp. 'monogermtubi']|nr:hypothetical protein LZ554_007820 [Drepanopeziza brunnea f. sp. 'monogermtubi']